MAVERTARGPGASAIEVPPEFLYAKLHGRRATIFEGDKLHTLAQASDIADLAYRIFPQAAPADQFELELRIQNTCVEELASVGRFTAGPQRALFDALMHRYVVEDLKVLLRLFKQEGAQAEPVSLIHLPPAYALPAELLAESANVEQFLSRIPLRAIRKSALAAMPIYHETGRKAFLEMAMDQGCWQEVGEALEELAAGDREDCEPIVQCEFDAVRFTAALRASRAYGLTWEQFGPLMPTGWGRLKTGLMRGLFENPSEENVLNALSLIAPHARRRPAGGETDVAAIEDSLRRETARMGHELFRSSENGFALLIAFFYLKQEETRQLLSLAQMVRRRMATQEILAYLER